jgi:hypothetical protein
MSHLVRNLKSNSPSDEWLPVNRQIVKLVHQWSRRDDLMVAIGPDFGGPTAFYDPKAGQIELNTNTAFGENQDPIMIEDLTVRRNQFDYPKAVGAVFHEAAHARFTSWSLEDAMNDLSEKENEWMHLLEEARIEKLALAAMPENKAFIRSCVLEIVLGEETTEEVMKMSGIRRAARLSLMGLARVDSGSLKKKDMKPTQEAIEKILGVSLLVQLRAIWIEFQSISNPALNLKRMYNLARKWSKLIDEAAKDEDKQDEENKQKQQEMQDAMDQIMEALGGQAERTEVEAQGDAYDQQTEEINEEKRKEKEAKRKEKEGNKNEAQKVFAKPETTQKAPPASGHDLYYGRTRFQIVEERAPSGPERRAAIQVGHDLEKAKYHDRIRIESNSVLPPGRLRTRAIVQGAAYKAQNIRITPEPFQRVQRKHEVDPNLAVGLMFDISGSMSDAMEPMGATAWIMTEAVRRIQGKFAMVAYGHEAKPIVAVGQRVEKVTVYSAPDGSEAFDSAFKALDGTLDLLNGSGARLLVVVSDGNYKQDEIQHTKRWLKRCQDEGVAVLWVAYGYAQGAQEFCKNTNAECIVPAATPSEVATQIGQAAIRALNAAGATRA